MVVLKRLSDAVRDRDHVLAVIAGSAINHVHTFISNGDILGWESVGLTAPNGKSQEAVIREALTNANVEPVDVQYVEAHWNWHYPWGSHRI